MAEQPETHVPHGYTVHNAREATILWKIAPYTDLVKRHDDHSIEILDYIETPYDEYGLVDKQLLIKRLLGSVAKDYHWEGSLEGMHHIMWPRRDYYYPNLTKKDALVASHFRSSPSQMITIKREPHEALHRLTLPPIMPHLDIMQQWNVEQEQVSKLYSIVRYNSMPERDLSFEAKEQLRSDIMKRKLVTMKEGYLGLMPSIELLETAPLAEVRQILRHRARPLGITADKACQKAFFA